MIRKTGFFTLTVLLLNATLHAALTSVGLNKNNYTSDFMIGHVVVSVIFPESNGSLDPNTETWTSERQSRVLSEIMTGMDWWTRQNSNSSVNFTLISQTISTKYEPITHPYYYEAQWIPDVMSKIGYNGSRFTATRNYVNDLREEYNADWGYVVFVVDSLMDTNGKFADGYFAYAYLGGPYLVMTYDNNGYGISNMDTVFAHETGHIFHALDQYAGASSPHDYSNGYFPTKNGNHQYSSTANDANSIMRGGIRWGLDSWSKLMIGWRDSNNNGRDDIVDVNPSVTYASQPSAQSGEAAFSGSASVNVLARQSNVQGFGFTVDSIAAVEYKLGNASWTQAIPTDGAFDSGSESFQFALNNAEISVQSISLQNISVRAQTEYTINSSGGGGGGSSSAASSLSDAHPYPNPYKPNSNLGHASGITFSGLTPGARIQIFTPKGESVYSKKLDPAISTLQWPAINDDGQTLSSGVYLYLITDDSGNKKDGKLAIIR